MLFVDHNTGASQVEFDPVDPRTVYAALWEHREGPWENGSFSGPNTGLYKSVDGGSTWRRLSQGLPAADRGAQHIFAVAPSNPRRLYALVGGRSTAGVYRSEDGGDTWAQVSGDRRLGVDIRVHPKNPDIVFAAGTCEYRSDDGGRTWTAIKGAPGGDDPQRLWINPLQPEIMLLTADQGATVSTNGGRTWSSWYNQPTAQLYHVATDTQFPYWVYGGQQESGAIGIASRGNGGQISLRDWIGVGADEYAYVAPDPLNPDIIYGGRVQRFNRKTGQSQNVAPEALRSGQYRILRTMPLLFHPADPRMLLFATNVLWKTTTGGQQWEIVSPDLSRERPAVPESIGDFRTPDLDTMPRRGVIYAVGPSPRDVNLIWAGTDDGLIHVTRDGGKTWSNVTPPALRPWDKVSQLVAGHFDTKTAYAAVNAIRRDDMRPHIYRTHDGGTTWTRVVNGLPDMGPVNVVREDPKQPGLLFAGTRASGVRVCRRWRTMAAAAAEHARHVDPGPRRSRRRPGGGHARAVHLDPRQHRAAARTGAGRERGARAPLRAAAWRPACGGTCSPTRRFRPRNPRARTRRTASRSTTTWPGPREEVVIEILDGAGGVVRRFSSRDAEDAIDASTAPLPHLLVPAAAAHRHRRRAPSHRVGPAVSASAGHGALVLDRGDLPATRRAALSGRSCTRAGTASG